MSDLLGDLVREMQTRHATSLLIEVSRLSARFGVNDAWSEAKRLDATEVATLDETLQREVIGPEAFATAVKGAVTKAVAKMGTTIDDASAVPTRTLAFEHEGRRVFVNAARLPGGDILVTALDWGDVPSLDEVLAPEECATLRAALRESYGLVIVAGSDAVRRRTLTRACVRELDPLQCNLFYVCESGEPALPGATRSAGTEVDRHERVRGALRWDPDVLVIAPASLDAPACELVVNAALTGHLVVAEWDFTSEQDARAKLAACVAPSLLEMTLRATSIA